MPASAWRFGMRPNFVADAYGWSEQERIIDRYDVMQRDKLPIAVNWMELEWRDHPVKMAQRFLIANGKMSLWLLVSFVVTSVVFAPLMRLFGVGFFSPVTYPVFCFLSALAAYFMFARTASFAVSASVFAVPQLAAILLELAFSPSVDRRLVILPVLASIAGVGYFADRINTHYVRWITANLRLKREAVDWRRSMWNQRFDWRALTRQIEAARESARTSESEGKTEEAEFYRRRAGELRELREYPLGFIVLVYLTAVLFLGAPSLILAGSGLFASACLAYRRPLIRRKLARLITEVILHSFISWLSWDTLQQWVNSPGMFRDGLSSRASRVTQTVVCFALIEFAFVPPIHLWGMGESRTPLWLWTGEYSFFVNLLLPPLLLVCTLVATGARPLWLHLEAVEWAQVTEELEQSEHFFDAVVGRLQGSLNSLERQHIWLGTHAEYGYPVLFRKPVLKEHVHIMGDSGSGKTS